MAANGRTTDAVTVLTLYLLLLFAIPSSLTVTALASAGRPAFLFALLMLLWWCWHHLQRRGPGSSGAPVVRIALAAFIAVAVASYGWAMLRGLPADEVSPSDSGLLRIGAWAGVLLIASDGISTAERLRTLLRRMALAGGAVATLGLLQFFSGQSLIDWLTIPGMSSDLAALAGVDARAGFTRASGTASHPIEYATLLSMTFPIALALALSDRERSRLLRWYPVAAIAMAATLSVSRSALVGLAVGLLALSPAWTPRVRAIVAVCAAALVVVTGLLVPGMLGTIRGMFTGVAHDPSAVSRADGQVAALELISRFPVLGKGPGTFLPRYHILDNQYLLLTAELGVLGLIAFLVLLVGALFSARSVALGAPRADDRHLARGLLASAAGGAVLMAFFDAFSFSISAGLMFLVVGLCAAAPRLLMHGDGAQLVRDRNHFASGTR